MKQHAVALGGLPDDGPDDVEQEATVSKLCRSRTGPMAPLLVSPATASGPPMVDGVCAGGPRPAGVERLADDVTGYPRGMAEYRLNKVAVKHARKLIDAGTYDDKTDWSEAAPSAADANKEIDKEGFDEFSEWHLGINPDASEGTKGRFAFPYGDLSQVNRAALIHAKQRAAQNE